MRKYSPTLERKRDFWMDDRSYDWACDSGIRRYWLLGEADHLWLCGSDHRTSGAVMEFPHSQLGWSHTPELRFRLDEYMAWLASFDAPCVWVWVEVEF